MKKTKWGIIGAGRIARAFAAALAAVPEAELYAVGSRSADKAVAFAEEFGFEHIYGSYDELLSDSSVDVVYVATPMAAHYDICMSALEKGRNVFCEKSVTLNASQLRDILALADECGLFFCEAMWMKCRPTYLKMKEWVAAGRIGDIRCIKADFSNFVPYDPDDRLFRADCGGGALLDVTVYPLTLVHDLLGAPDSIDSAAHIENGIDLSESLILRYASGTFASIDCGFEMSLRNNAVISGNDGSIVFGDCFFCSDTVALYDRDRRLVEQYGSPARVNGYEYEIEEVHRCLTQGLRESPLIPHSSTLEIMELMDGLRREWGLKFPQE
ncbi:MAG: Gfo/Idh/MocA family oxidoreductase [Ruminococcus sp.]|nr:Gfo/Idh/MocA family oxidoreductase [Ruminococcus sp.]